MIKDRILAVDYGTKRVGLSVSDPLGYTAQPLPYLSNQSRAKLLEALLNVVHEKSVKRVVVGLPKSLDDTLGPKARECQKFADDLRAATGLPVDLLDERFTSREAEDFLVNQLDLSREKRKELRDSLAACIILETYMKANP